MGLFDQNAQEGASKVEKAVEGTEVKASAGKKAYDWQKRKNQALYEAALKVVAAVPAEAKKALTAEIALLTRVPGSGAAGGGTFGKPVLYKIFGDTPVVGTRVPTMKVIHETNKGFRELEACIKKWAEKGNIVKYLEKEEVFVLEAIGTLP